MHLFSNWKKWLIVLIAVAVVGFIGLIGVFFAAGIVIGKSVEEKCQYAKMEYKENDCVLALIQLVDDRAMRYHDRNDAVWALGQLGDDRALPILEKYYTGYKDSRCRYNEEISQYELYKAIKLVRGGFNASKIVW